MSNFGSLNVAIVGGRRKSVPQKDDFSEFILKAVSHCHPHFYSGVVGYHQGESDKSTFIDLDGDN